MIHTEHCNCADCRAEAIRVDWTIDPETRRSNSSPRFRALADHVELIIRDSAHDLIGGRTDRVAGLVMAQLAHKHGVLPAEEPHRSPVVFELMRAAEAMLAEPNRNNKARLRDALADLKE